MLLISHTAERSFSREYIQEKLRSAVWLIKSIYHRQGTIVNVMKSIIKFQRDFFNHGIGFLKPLVRRDVERRFLQPVILQVHAGLLP